MSKVGLLNKTITKVMEENNIIPSPIIKLNFNGIYTLNMLYDFWLAYAYQNDLIHEQYIYPDETINNLLFNQYMRYGGSIEGNLLETFLRMLSSQINFNTDIELSDAIIKQSKDLRLLRSGYPI